MKKDSYFYILASQRNGTLYKGVTSDLIKRVSQHRNKESKGFTAKYNVTMLVYYEVYPGIEDAIKREREVKAWKRNWKLKLIEDFNPQWKDLFDEICS